MRISLKAARVNKNLKQKELAKALGVTQKTVCQWESGKVKPRFDKIEPLCKILGVSYDNINWNA